MSLTNWKARYLSEAQRGLIEKSMTKKVMK